MNAALLFVSLLSPTLPDSGREPRMRGGEEPPRPMFRIVQPRQPPDWLVTAGLAFARARNTIYETEDTRISWLAEIDYPWFSPKIGYCYEGYLGKGVGYEWRVEIRGMRLACPLIINYYPHDNIMLGLRFEPLAGKVEPLARLELWSDY